MEKLFYTVPEFCAAYGISRSKLYLMWKEKNGPALIKIGSRTLIAKTDAAKWASNLPRTLPTNSFPRKGRCVLSFDDAEKEFRANGKLRLKRKRMVIER